MTKYVVFRAQDTEGAERFWYSWGDGKRSAIFDSFAAMLEELVPAFNFQRSHNVSATIASGPDDGIVFMPQPEGGLFRLHGLSFQAEEQLWHAISGKGEPEADEK